MSGSLSTGSVQTSTGTVYLLFPDKPDYYVYSAIYDPTQTYPAGSKLTVPPVGSLIAGDATEDNVLYRVRGVAGDYTLTLEPIYTKLSNDGYGQSSVISYGNTMFRAYYDTRTQPYTLSIDRVVFYGGLPSVYTIVRYPGTNNEKVVSLNYDESGKYMGAQVPMLRLEQNQNSWYCKPCNIDFIPADDEELLVKVFNDAGSLIATCTVFAKKGDIVNLSLQYRPKILDLKMDSTQQLTDGTGCYIYEKQSFDDLNITGILLFDDNTTRKVIVDYKSLYLIGQEDFVSAYAGQRQKLMLKYFLSDNETIDGNASKNVTVVERMLSKEFDIKVIPNELAVPIKLSVFPVWNVTLGAYQLEYFYYSTDHTKSVNVTTFMSVKTGKFDGSFFTDYQVFTAGLDMNLVDPINYPNSTTYVQSFAIKLQPPAALERYIIKDAMSSPYVYGADSSSSRRPILYYDPAIQKYFIPSTVFMNDTAVTESFYYNNNPPYDATTESKAPTPTHFIIRDPISGAMLTALPIPIDNYAAAFSLVTANTYTGGTLVVEFVQQMNEGYNLILFGSPVDVYAGTYNG